jgi:hypothetical protein
MLNMGVPFDSVARDSDGNLNYKLEDLKLSVIQE